MKSMNMFENDKRDKDLEEMNEEELKSFIKSNPALYDAFKRAREQVKASSEQMIAYASLHGVNSKDSIKNYVKPDNVPTMNDITGGYDKDESITMRRATILSQFMGLAGDNINAEIEEKVVNYNNAVRNLEVEVNKGNNIEDSINKLKESADELLNVLNEDSKILKEAGLESNQLNEISARVKKKLHELSLDSEDK